MLQGSAIRIKSISPAASRVTYRNFYKLWNMFAIVGLTQAWQTIFPFFCNETFEFAVQTWKNPVEHYRMCV